MLEDFKKKELIANISDEDDLTKLLVSGKVHFYCGFDPSADSLHIGSLLPLKIISKLNLNNNAIILLGGGTGLIGDPSFKAVERALQTREVIEYNKSKIKQQVQKLLNDNTLIIDDNYNWLGNLNLLDFLRDIGKYFSVNSMIAKESIKNRLDRTDQGISYTEFSYILLQAYDFIELYKRYNCILQLGGSDQWGNITAGITLGRRLCNAKLYGMTFPLLVKADGSKFGKSEKGNIWLNSNLTSHYSFYQFWINTSDEDVYNYLKYFTDLSYEEVNDIYNLDKNKSGKKDAQIILANEVTKWVHGIEACNNAKRISSILFTGEISKLELVDVKQLIQDGLPAFKIDKEVELIDILITSKLAASKRRARELLFNNSISVNGQIIQNVDSNYKLNADNALYDKYFIIRRGKKNYIIVYLEN